MNYASKYRYNCSILAKLYCLVYDKTNKPSTATDFNHYFIVIFALQFRDTETIFSTLHLIDTEPICIPLSTSSNKDLFSIT